MQNISGELQDLAFPYLHPKEYDWLKQTSKAQYEKRLAYLEAEAGGRILARKARHPSDRDRLPRQTVQ